MNELDQLRLDIEHFHRRYYKHLADGNIDRATTCLTIIEAYEDVFNHLKEKDARNKVPRT